MPPSNLLLASKIVIVEEPPSIRNIPGVPTAITAFLGVTERGPLRVPSFATSFSEFTTVYGGFIATSDLPLSVQGYFLNGGTATWISRTNHYTDINDPQTATAKRGQQDIGDRGGVAGPAVLLSNPGPFQLKPAEQLDVNIDAAGTDSLVFAATQAVTVSGNSEVFALVNGDTIVYRTNNANNTTALGPLRTITFLTAEFVSIGAATAEEVAAVINTKGQGISAEATGGGTTVTIRSDARGTGATLVIDGTSTATAAGKLDIPTGTTNGTGNVSLIDAVTATEIAGLLTGLPLSAGTATVSPSDEVTLTSALTGNPAATVVIEATTTALGIFVGALPITQFGVNALESPSIRVFGKTEGDWIVTPVLYAVVVEAPTSGNTDEFNFRVKKGTVTEETFPNLSMDPLAANYFETIVNENSNLVELEDLFSPATSPNNLPKLGEFNSWVNQDAGLVGLVDVDFTGTEAGKTGLFAFDEVDNITILSVPGRATVAVHLAMINYCEIQRVGTCFAILDPPEGLTAVGIKDYVNITAAIKGISEFAAIYWPRVKIANQSTAVFGAVDELVVPPSGHIAGVYARTDASQPGGVFQPPAGVERGILQGVLGFETDEVLDERKRDLIFPERINPLTVIDGSPRHIDGSRTLKGDGNFPFVAERRGVIFIEVSLKRGLLFAKQRNNDRRLRMEVKRSIEAFLLRQFAVEAFRGDTPSESFNVDVSDALNPPEKVFAGELNARVQLATQKPAEFIILTFTQDTRALEESLANQLGG